jgi:endoglucanase
MNLHARVFLMVSGLFLWVLPLQGQHLRETIRLNQVGVCPAAPKLAIVAGTQGSPFYLTTPNLATTVFTGELGPPPYAGFSFQRTRSVDFSACSATGTFVVWIPARGFLRPFPMQPDVHADLARTTLKSGYFQPVSISLSATYVGRWASAGSGPVGSGSQPGAPGRLPLHFHLG